MNLLILKGPLTCQAGMSFKMKVILPQNFPYRAPKAYIDETLEMEVIKSKTYIGQFNEISINYIKGWNMSNQPNLKDMMQFIQSILMSDPPVLSAQQRSSVVHASGANKDFNPQDIPKIANDTRSGFF
jgi:ubiquitin-protein ligase